MNGFTLIELLATMTVIAILTSIAVPQFNDYKKRGYDIRAQQDLRNIALAQESYFLDEEEYLSCVNAACSSLPGVSSLSKGVELSVTATEATFLATSTHPKGTGKVFEWDSEGGGLQG